MKKQDIILIAGVVAILIIAVLVMNTMKTPKIDLPLVLTGEETELTKIDYSTYKEKIKNGDNFIIVIERTGCSFCEMYMPVLEDVASEYLIPIYYIDTADLTGEEYSDLGESNSYLKRNQWGTPTTLLMSGEIVVDSIGQYVEKDSFVEDFLNKNIVLKEKEENKEE